jgi:hypothetical protein
MNNSQVCILGALVCLVVACAPAVNLTFQTQSGTQAQQMVGSFKDVFSYYQVQIKEQMAYRYDGNDERAFLLAIDQFYLANPGFCPMVDGFHVSSDGTLQLTMAAKKEQVTALIYDLRNKPKFEYTIASGISQTTPATRPCRNGN